jgi:hypothetical protein
VPPRPIASEPPAILTDRGQRTAPLEQGEELSQGPVVAGLKRTPVC